MDGNSSLDRRYSFLMQSNNPVAESTHLNGNSFCWGSSSLLSPKQRSNSNLCLNTQNESRNFVTSPKSKNATKIDARIVADVQSKGLASRIVKYHETGTRLNRSMSAHNLYNKPGQFPVVNLKKVELPYRATQNNLSMTRIAPPEKSLFYGKTISGLLRSSSVVQKRNEDISHDRNRPILHYPPNENDMAPTRSVLDELKEISRKRINSDDLESTEASKKYCNRAAGNDIVDTGGLNATYTPPHLLAASMKTFKRQREINALLQSKQMPELQTSPEQAKKRLCNYNNDITSSLSSSKSYERKRPSTYYLNQTMPSNLESYESQRAKIQRYYEEHNNLQADLRYDHLVNTNLRKEDNGGGVIQQTATASVEEKQQKGSSNNMGVAPQRTISEPLYKEDNKKSAALNQIQPANKPRLTLFNKNYDVATEKIGDPDKQEDDLNDSAGDCAGIQFVKPKKLTSKTGSKNPVIERTHKSKLALMLSGLRGELYQASDADELDSLKPVEKVTKTVESNDNVNKLEPISTPKPATESSTNAVIKGIQIVPTTTTTTTTVVTDLNKTLPLSATTTPPKSTGSPLVGIKLTPQKSTTAAAESAKPIEATAKANVPVLGGFSFGTVAPTLTTTPSKTTDNSVKEPSGDKSNQSATPVLNFAQIPAPAKDNSVPNLQFNAPSSGFSLATTSTTSAVTSSSSDTITPSKPAVAFSFGKSPLAAVTPNNAVTTNDTTSGSLNSSAKPNASFSFGVTPVFGSSLAATTPAANTTTSTTTNAPSTNTFSFGLANASAAAPTSSAVPVFGAAAAASTTNNAAAPTTTPSFSFGGAQLNQQTSNTTNSGGFSFAANPLVKASTPAPNAAIQSQPTNSFSFGSTNAVQSSAASNNNTTPAFGSNTNSPAPSAFAAPAQSVFGASANESSVFGSPAGGNAAKNVFGSTNAASSSIFGAVSANTNPPAFGSTSNNNPPAFGSNTANNPPAFGTNTANNPPAFGSISANNNPPAFGSSTANNNPPPSFAAATANSNTPTFGSTAANNTPTFGSAAANNNTPTFGSAATNNNTPTFGSAATNNNTPTFGSSSDNKSSSIFGNNTIANNASSPFSFGSKASDKPANNNPPPAFGSSVDNKSTSVFGNTSNSNATTSSPFSFGAKAMEKPNANATASTNSGGFSFGSTTTQTKMENKPADTAAAGGFSFGSALSAKSAANTSSFSFGTVGNNSSANNMTNNSNAAASNSFSFGGAGAAPSAKPNEPKPFSFGTAAAPNASQASNNNNSSSNIFGSPAQIAKPASPAFNFGSAGNIQSNAVAPSPNNIFAPPPATSNMPASPGNRPIRRATRRLQK